ANHRVIAYDRRGFGRSSKPAVGYNYDTFADFRRDIPRNTVPTLILHGDADRILPPEASSRRQAKMIKDARFMELKDGPHGVLWTHAEQINSELVKFLA